MKELQVARNVVNTDEIDAFCDAMIADQTEPKLKDWIGTTLRKWVMRKAPATATAPAADPNMPAWLRDAMSRGDALEVVDMQQVDALVQPVLDYMADLLEQRPDTDIKQIGFDVASARAKKWHEDMGRESERRARVIEPVAEEGTKILKTYPDGYTWRNVFGKDQLNREGDEMGHCVGRFNYWASVVRDRLSIVSLRDAENMPHVTIEIRNKKDIRQIKGKANLEVLPKYIPYVVDYLKSRTWASINYDEAPSIEQEMNLHHRQTAEPWYAHGHLRAVQSLGFRYVLDTRYEILAPDHTCWGWFNVNGTGNTITLFLVENVAQRRSPEMVAFMARVIVDKQLWCMPHILWSVFDADQTQWNTEALAGESATWDRPANLPAQATLQALVGNHNAMCLRWHNAVIGSCVDNVFTYQRDASDYERWIKWTLDAQPKEIVAINMIPFLGDVESKPEFLTDITLEAQRLLKGRGIKTEVDPRTTLDTLLTALRQPTVPEIKAAYLSLRTHKELKDGDFKAHAIATGGRAINSVALVLASSLAIKNLAPFQRYVFSKPNALNNFVEVLTQPKHIHASLSTFGLTDRQIDQILEVLRNEYLRLLPQPAELDALALDESIRMRVAMVRKHVGSAHSNHTESKRIWS